VSFNRTPKGIIRALRKEDQCGEAVGKATDGGADTDFRLDKAVVATFARTVEKNNERPFFVSGIVVGT